MFLVSLLSLKWVAILLEYCLLDTRMPPDRSVVLLWVAASLDTLQSVVEKQFWSASDDPLGHTRICLLTGLTTLTSGLYAGVSITVVWSDAPRFEHYKLPKSEERPTPHTLMPPPTSLLDPSDLDPSGSTPGSWVQDWFNAADFGSGQPYCGRADPENKELRKQLCFYAAIGKCRYGINCAYLHGDVCNMCELQVLHPTDISQRSEHTKACMEAHEKDMELSFAIQRSEYMMCRMCIEVVLEKANPSERRFGILVNCSHCYCLKCIRTWRRAMCDITNCCPKCGITSNFVIPSEFWVEDEDDKQKLIQKYKDGMRNKPCRYFDEGRGTCPFGAICFYKHAFPGGRLLEAQPPRRQPGSNDRNRQNSRTPLWNIFEEQESTDSFNNDEEEMVPFELREMLLRLLDEDEVLAGHQ
ncbi:probable E3 ubiquitin-protein ligase makorin-1 [Antennarius striatus]|uniref:probable E3 ubiquitin-protein ligase makorin-1 n=1 Tax=Antennarius striatus TaxID=241820 RepID=UPI0035B0340E